MVVVQRSIIWSPHEGQNQFLVGDSELRLYEWTPESNNSPGTARYISTVPDINLMMCADWSPDPNCPDLIAVGLTTGRTLLVRLYEHSLTNYRIPDGSKTPTQGGNTIIYSSSNPEDGSSSSSANSIRQHQQQAAQTQQKQYPSLGVKLSRSSNVVSFSKTHPHLLAAGLDKVRNDPCLLVWDVTRSLNSYCNTPTGAQTPTAFNMTKTVNQQELRAAITNQWRVETGRPSTDAHDDRSKYNDIPPISSGSSGTKEQGPVRQYGSSEAISSCAWSIHAHAPLLMAGMGNKYLRVYDIRADPSSSPLQFVTKAVHNVVVDPFNPYRVASHTEEGVIKLWDIRRNSNSILTLTPETKGNLSRILFSTTQPGFLASLTKDSSHIDLWDIQETCSLQVAVNSSVVLQQQQKSSHTFGSSNRTPALSGSSLSNTTLFNSKTGLQHQSVLPTLLSETSVDHLSIPVLWKSRKTRYSSKKFASFTFVPPSAIVSNNVSRPYSKQLPNAQAFLTVHNDGKFDYIKVQEACQMAWQPTGGMIMTGKKGLLSYLPLSSADNSILDGRKESLHKGDEESLQRDFSALDVSHAQEQPIQRLILKTEISALDKDISVVMRRRLMEGYSMDSTKNLKIIKDNHKLRELWSWIKLADQISDKLSKVGNADYSFHGVYGIWIETAMGSNTGSAGHGLGGSMNSGRMMSGISNSANNRPSSPAAVTSRSVSPQLTRHNTSVTLKLKDTTMAESVTTAASTHNPYPAEMSDQYKLPMVDTNKPTLRYLALSACGYAFDVNGFAKELEALERRGEYDKAAALALFHDNTERAIKALNNAKRRDKNGEQQHKLLSAVLASYQGSNASNNVMWREICESLSDDLKDRPYLKAIFAYISSNNWYKVLDERAIPLRERMAIALRVLKDEALTSYINRTVDTLIEEGDIEGVVVTGLTPKGVELLAKVVDKTNDVQTASLVMSYVVPKKFKDSRVGDWIESYRLLMDRWQMWHARAKYDIQRGKRMNSSEIAPPQVYVRCNFCAQSVGHSVAAQNGRNRDGKRLNVQTSTPGGRITGKQKSSVCPNCRKPLPRCALCLLHMGTPIDQLREPIMANDTHKSDPAGFDLWFTWCQTCRHGGHVVHMFDWFQKHSTCPVSSCTCQCQILDM